MSHDAGGSAASTNDAGGGGGGGGGGAAVHLEALVAQLQSPDNAVRNAAEQLFVQACQHPDFLLPELVRLIRSSSHPGVKGLSAILFRRCAFSKRMGLVWEKCAPNTQALVQHELLEALKTETDASVRQKLCDTIAETAQFLMSNQQEWDGLLTVLFQLSSSPEAFHREASFIIFNHIPTIFGDKVEKYITVVKDLFASGLQDPGGMKVRLEALKATTSFIVYGIQPKDRNFFDPLLPKIINVIGEALHEGNEDAAQDALTALIDVAETAPTFLRNHLATVVQTMAQISSNSNLDIGTRNSAIEVLVSLAEKAPGMIRKSRTANFMEAVVPICMSMMVQLDDNELWHSTDDLNDDDDEVALVGEQAIDRIACALKGKTVLPHVLNPIRSMLLNHHDWRHRQAALFCLSAIGEGCQSVMEPELPQILSLIRPYLEDPHPRVRYAFCNLLGQISTDFAPTVQNEYHSIVAPLLLHGMRDSSLRVKCHACLATVNFVENASKETLNMYLSQFLDALLFVLQHAEKRYIMEQSVTTIATIADSVEDLFIPYYDHFMPLLKDLLAKANGVEYRLLRGKTIECISIIGLAVGKEKFFGDAKHIMDELMRTQASLEEDDPQVSYMLSSWARIGTVLGDDFTPYLPFVIPPLLKSAQVKASATSVYDEPDSQFDGQDGWEVIRINDQRIAIKTSALEEKLTAVEMLSCYAKELKAGFSAYANEVLQIVVPLLQFYLDDSIRTASAATLGPLLRSVQLANFDARIVHQMWHTACMPLLTVIGNEVENDPLIKFSDALSECVDIVGQDSMTDDELRKFSEVVVYQLESWLSRSKERVEQRASDDWDDEMEEDIANENEDEEDILQTLSDTIKVMFKTQLFRLLPFLHDGFFPLLERLISTPGSLGKDWAFCVFDDFIEFGGAASWTYQSLFLDAMVKSIADESAAVRRAVYYGFGQCAKYGGADYHQVCIGVLPLLLQVAQAPDSKSDDNVFATENAISAIGKICQYVKSPTFDPAAILPSWLMCLPVLNDEEEANQTFGYLCDLIERNDPAIFGENFSNLPRIFSVLGQGLTSNVLEAEAPATRDRLIHIAKLIQQQLPENLRPALWSQVDPKDHAALQKLLEMV